MDKIKLKLLLLFTQKKQNKQSYIFGKSSLDCRSAKYPKVNTIENSFKKSEKGKTEDIVVIAGEKKDKNDSTTVEDAAKLGEKSDTDSPKNKKTPGRGLGKHKKTESKVPVNPLTKFFKKIGSKDSKTEAQSPSSKNNEGETEKSVETESKDDSVIENVEVVFGPKFQSSIIVEKGMKIMDSCGDDGDCQVEAVNTPQSKKGKQGKLPFQTQSTDSPKVNKKKKSVVSPDCRSAKHPKVNTKENSFEKSEKGKTEDIVVIAGEKKDKNDSTTVEDAAKLEERSDTPAKNKLLDSQRQETKKKLQEERESRKREKEEKQRERKEKKRERKEKENLAKEQKQKQKELKEQKKLAELEQKQKEKEAKEEDRRKREEAKEEEKKRKEEEKREEAKEEEKKRKKEEKLEAERKKQKEASNFVSFFVLKKPAETKPVEVEQKVENRNFVSFEVKADMRLAPAVRRKMSDGEKSKFDDVFAKNDVKKSSLYISELRSNKFEIRKSKNTWPPESNDDVVVLEGDDEESANVVQATKIEKHRAKLFLFEESRRPPYWGIWRKKHGIVNLQKLSATSMLKGAHFQEASANPSYMKKKPTGSLNILKKE